MIIPIVICEGRSEFAYVQSLNRMLTTVEGRAAFVPKSADCGNFSAIKRCYQKQKKSNRESEILIWVDRDIYVRSKVEIEAYAKKKNIPDFFFSTMNFEDVLALHQPKSVLYEWDTICVRKNHFTNPMTDDQYIPLYTKTVCSDYRKGTFPPGFRLTKTVLENAFANNEDPNVNIRCDFLTWLKKQIENGVFQYIE